MRRFRKVHAERLLTLAWFLKTQVEPEHFDLGTFISVPNKGAQDYSPDDLLAPECGTTACAIGWCAVVFPDECKLRRWLPVFSGSGLSCGSRSDAFFGVHRGEWCWLFGQGHTRTPKQEARVIEQFVRSKGWVYA